MSSHVRLKTLYYLLEHKFLFVHHKADRIRSKIMNVSMTNYAPKSSEDAAMFDCSNVKTILNDDLELMDSIDLEDDFLLEINEKMHYIPETFCDPKVKVSSCDSLGKPRDSMDLDDMPSMDIPASTENPEVQDLQDQYRAAFQQLTAAMKRSEVTRNNIIRLRENASGEGISAKQVLGFLSGSKTTLTSGLEQSRGMLHALKTQMPQSQAV